MGTGDLSEFETLEPESGLAEACNPRQACLTVAWHPDASRVGDRLCLPREALALSRIEPAFQDGQGRSRGPLACLNLSRKPILLRRARGGVELEASEGGSQVRVAGQVLVGRRRFERAELETGVVLELARRIVLLLHLSDPAPREEGTLGLVGESDALERLRAHIRQVAPGAAPALVLGETGAGKELVARALHARSGRPGPFVAVNLAAVPASVAASELFGHVAGAFTGASGERRGFFEQADRGTLFLDEVGAADVQLQAALLRALESGEVQPLGARGPRRVDVRTLAATDTDLERAVAAGRFRAPLYHRLAGHLVRVPPLRERRDDIGRLLVHFLRARLAEQGAVDRLSEPKAGASPWLPAEFVARLIERPWPGNVRELSNLAHRLVASSASREVVESGALEEESARQEPAPSVPRAPEAERVALAELSGAAVTEALTACGFRIGATARRLGISRNSLYALMARTPGLRRAKDLTAEEITRCREACGGDLEAMGNSLAVSTRALKLRMRDLGLT
jgi:two-component system nitrogen regulation response regulator GlnG